MIEDENDPLFQAAQSFFVNRRVSSYIPPVHVSAELRDEMRSARSEALSRVPALYEQLVDTAAERFVSTSQEGRLNYLRELRGVLREGLGNSFGLGVEEMFDFSDRLIIKVVESLPQNSDN